MFKIAEQRFRPLNQSKSTTRYLGVNSRLVFFKILDDELNERLRITKIDNCFKHIFHRIVGNMSSMDASDIDSESESEDELEVNRKKIKLG